VISMIARRGNGSSFPGPASAPRMGTWQCRADAGRKNQKLVARSRPHQFRLPSDGRKWRLQCIRRRELALYLVGYRDCFPGLLRIARDLGWSRRTVCRVMAELKALGVMQPLHYTTEHGTRRRIIRAYGLRESGTPARRESGTQELPRKKHVRVPSVKSGQVTEILSSLGFVLKNLFQNDLT
jgi:hypothetical protein